MTAARYCHACGSPLRGDANFCRGCGARRAIDVDASHAYEQAIGGDATASLRQHGAVPAGPHPATESSTSVWVIVAAGVVATLLIVGVVSVLLLTGGGKGQKVHPASVVPLRALAEAEANAAPRLRDVQRSSSSGPPRSPSQSASTPAPDVPSAPRSYVLYRGRRFTARVPAGWKLLEDEAQKEGYVESKWQSSASAEDTVLIDTSPATDLTLEQDAAPVHADLERAVGYQQVSYGPGDLSGVDSWMWVFHISGDERIDYFFNNCTRGFGLLGSSPASRFEQMRSTYRAVAQSTRAVCG